MCKYANVKIIVTLSVIVISVFFQSCNIDSNKNISEKKVEEKGTASKLSGRWQEEKDTAHLVSFDHQKMTVFYNGSQINQYDYTVFQGIPGDGGFESASGRTIRIEESKDNFYNFLIIVLDSNYLELKHQDSDLTWFFKKLN